MKALVVGSSGQLGPIWCEVVQGLGYELETWDYPGIDIADRAQVCMRANLWAPDALVLNAAIDNPPGTDASFHGNMERILAVNLIGCCNVVNAFMPALLLRGNAVIVFIGSIMGFIGADWRNYEEGFEKPVAYNLSKAALMQYARSLTTQYGRYGIRACCIAFGPFDGGRLEPVFLEKFLRNVPMGRAVSVESVRAALRFALTCPEFAGQTVAIDGGYLSF